jgi:hypothetical protein
MPLIYIAAPFRGNTPAQERINVLRAETLAAWAVVHGDTPLYTHSMPIFGGDDRDPVVRGRAMKLSVEYLRIALSQGGRMWVVSHDDGSFSPGVATEVGMWRQLSSALTPDPLIRTWAQWEDAIQDYSPNILGDYRVKLAAITNPSLTLHYNHATE